MSVHSFNELLFNNTSLSTSKPTLLLRQYARLDTCQSPRLVACCLQVACRGNIITRAKNVQISRHVDVARLTHLWGS